MQGNNLLIPLLTRVHGKKKMHNVIQNSTVFSIFFFNEQRMKQHHFKPNVSFHLKQKDAKTCQFPNQFLIFYLFNQVLNSDFKFKN